MKFVPHKDFWSDRELPEPQTEYRFHPTRKWRFDYSWPLRKVAVEVEGGIWVKGAHTRGAHFLSDAEKYNEATRLGWRIYRFTPQQMPTEETAQFLRSVFKGA